VDLAWPVTAPMSWAGWPLPAAAATGGCERLRDGLLAEPVSAVTSLAFLAAGLAVLAARDDRPHPAPRRWFGLLVLAVGVGSVIQHGPRPPGQDLAHDLPLVALLALVLTDCLADLTGRRLRAWWWLLPTAALAPVIVLAPAAGDAAQGVLGALAVAAGLARARLRPSRRRALLTALLVLGLAAAAGTLTRAGMPLCQPESLWQGHGAWHLLAAAALWLLAPVISTRGARPADVTRAPAVTG
jgi:hypothetical protein